MKRLFLFDLGKVLIDFDFGIAVRRLAALYPVDGARLKALFLDSSLAAGWDRGDLSEEEFFERVRKELALPLSMREFIPIWNGIFTEKRETIALVQSLKKQGKVVILSNTNPWHAGYIRAQYPWIHSFDGFLASCDLKLLKPDPAIFHVALESAGVQPESTLYVDDRAENVAAAARLGMDAILFRDHAGLVGELDRRGIPTHPSALTG